MSTPEDEQWEAEQEARLEPLRFCDCEEPVLGTGTPETGQTCLHCGGKI